MINKSDKKAKDAYAQELKHRGFENIKIVKEPSDIIAKKMVRNSF